MKTLAQMERDLQVLKNRRSGTELAITLGYPVEAARPHLEELDSAIADCEGKIEDLVNDGEQPEQDGG